MATVVVKIGSSSLTDHHGVIDTALIDGVCAQVAALRESGDRVVLVSSGAVSAGVAVLGLPACPGDLPTCRRSPRSASPADEGVRGRARRPWPRRGQVLLVPHDFINRRQYLHAR